ncbi:hypothetical protein C5167_037220 [Papaver somniferum]|uniref:Uncharacterized protein n=1 Tax=Papaver somniferum TaxID=3469 RepID=A0A4Y7I9U6_PAPSO|nr:hypothetical protein C5167_037220 [Papaver somniferum]
MIPLLDAPRIGLQQIWNWTKVLEKLLRRHLSYYLSMGKPSGRPTGVVTGAIKNPRILHLVPK